jgi:hypothetical protein
LQLGTAVLHKQTLLINNANTATSEICVCRVIAIASIVCSELSSSVQASKGRVKLSAGNPYKSFPAEHLRHKNVRTLRVSVAIVSTAVI